MWNCCKQGLGFAFITTASLLFGICNVVVKQVRGLAGGLSIAAQYYGMKHMPIAEANMISAASPIWTALMARFILKEPLGFLDVLNVILTILGLVFIIRPPFIYGYDTDLVVGEQHHLAAMIVFGSTFLRQRFTYF